jgi:hypothetical protein
LQHGGAFSLSLAPIDNIANIPASDGEYPFHHPLVVIKTQIATQHTTVRSRLQGAVISSALFLWILF